MANKPFFVGWADEGSPTISDLDARNVGLRASAQPTHEYLHSLYAQGTSTLSVVERRGNLINESLYIQPLTRPMNNTTHHNDPLNQCAETLGMIEAIDMFDYALPRIVQRKQELCHYLQTQDWEAAKQCAHQTISSVRLYGSKHLEAQLRQVSLLGTNNHQIDPIQLEKTLAQAFDQTIQTVTVWLDKHKNG